MIDFLVSTTLVTAAMSGAVAYLWRGWRNEARDHHRTINERDLVEDAHLIAKGRADAANEALVYTADRLAVALRHITDIEPLADLGRKTRAHRQRQDAARRAKRAAKA